MAAPHCFKAWSYHQFDGCYPNEKPEIKLFRLGSDENKNFQLWLFAKILIKRCKGKTGLLRFKQIFTW